MTSRQEETVNVTFGWQLRVVLVRLLRVIVIGATGTDQNCALQLTASCDMSAYARVVKVDFAGLNFPKQLCNGLE